MNSASFAEELKCYPGAEALICPVLPWLADGGEALPRLTSADVDALAADLECGRAAAAHVTR